MPIIDCKRDGKNGKKWGDGGFCFIGDGAERKAQTQGIAIKHNKKGAAGKGTGASARAAIQKAIDGGHTLEDIGKAAGRDADTISQIRSGRIENPPRELITAIQGMKAKPKP